LSGWEFAIPWSSSCDIVHKLSRLAYVFHPRRQHHAHVTEPIF
jgi:hypothetical protein